MNQLHCFTYNQIAIPLRARFTDMNPCSQDVYGDVSKKIKRELIDKIMRSCREQVRVQVMKDLFPEGWIIHMS